MRAVAGWRCGNRGNVASVLIEADDAVCEGSRAICVSRGAVMSTTAGNAFARPVSRGFPVLVCPLLWGPPTPQRTTTRTDHEPPCCPAFAHDPLRSALIATGDAQIIEGNIWGDTYWGVDVNKGGMNRLGILLMQVRDEIKEPVFETP